MSRFAAIAVVAVFLAVPAAHGTLPSHDAVLGNGTAAAKYFIGTHPRPDCGWERGTFMLGLIELFKSVNEAAFHEYALEWAESYNWQLCGGKKHAQGVADPPGKEDANNQLCGATFAELYLLAHDGNSTWLADTLLEFGKEMADPSTSNYWSWVDALFMAMNTWARIGKIKNDQRYFDKMWTNFQASALLGPDKVHTFHFWNTTDQLFYRDDRFLGTKVYWARGNSWAMSALVAAIEHSPKTDPHRATYISMLQQQAAALKKIQGSDGCWRASLLNATGYPTAETTGSSGYTFGMAYGINNGYLSRADYYPTVDKAWGCLSQKALQPSGLFGYCQPVGGSPEHNITPNSTSDFCVGLFLLASTEVAKLAATLG